MTAEVATPSEGQTLPEGRSAPPERYMPSAVQLGPFPAPARDQPLPPISTAIRPNHSTHHTAPASLPQSQPPRPVQPAPEPLPTATVLPPQRESLADESMRQSILALGRATTENSEALKELSQQMSRLDRQNYGVVEAVGRLREEVEALKAGQGRQGYAESAPEGARGGYPAFHAASEGPARQSAGEQTTARSPNAQTAPPRHVESHNENLRAAASSYRGTEAPRPGAYQPLHSSGYGAFNSRVELRSGSYVPPTEASAAEGGQPHPPRSFIAPEPPSRPHASSLRDYPAHSLGGLPPPHVSSMRSSRERRPFAHYPPESAPFAHSLYRPRSFGAPPFALQTPFRSYYQSSNPLANSGYSSYQSRLRHPAEGLHEHKSSMYSSFSTSLNRSASLPQKDPNCPEPGHPRVPEPAYPHRFAPYGPQPPEQRPYPRADAPFTG